MKFSANSLYREVVTLITITAVLFAFHILLVSTFSVQIDWMSKVSFLDKAIYLNRFYSDFFIALSLACLFYGGTGLSRLFSCLILFLFLFFFFVQYQSYTVTGGFLPSIALENIDHVDLLNTDNIFYSGIIWVIFFIVACLLVHVFSRAKIRMVSRIVFAFIIVLLSSLIKNDKYFLDDLFLSSRSNFYNSGRPGFPHESPLSELGDTVKDYQKYLYKQKWVSEKSAVLSSNASEFAYKHYKFLGQTNPDLPLVHETIFESPLPFDSILKVSKSQSPKLEKKKKNIIIFFMEGVSSRIIQPYSQRLPNMSPNIDEFARKKSIRIDNYYNHTFATYRALGGQLCSLYPIGRLLGDTKYNCLPHILNKAGYSTRFLFSQLSKTTDLDEVFSRAGFQSIDSATSIHSLLEKSYGDSILLSRKNTNITDKELMLGLIQRLKVIEDTDVPFFKGIYNIETHTGIRLFMDNTIYHLADGENSYILNAFHNFDKVFGLFWDYFKESPHADDTIVVLTSDHATFPGRDYLNLKLGAPKMFVDKIPFLIYHPDLESTFLFDANSRTSIDFAPTILNILGIENQYTHFLGKSLFSDQGSIPPSVVGTETTLWQLNKQNNLWLRISKGADRNTALLASAVDQFEFINYLSSLERQNKLWESTQ